MNRKFMRFVSLLLTLCMLVSLASCKPEDKKPADKPGSSNSAIDNTDDSSSALDGATSEIIDGATSEIIDGMEDLNGIVDIVDTAVVRPVTDDAISVGIKLAYVPEEEKEPIDDEDLEGEKDEDWVVDDDLVEEFEYEFLIQPYGTLEVKGKKRVIEVTNSKDGVLFTNFSGVNTNVYPTLMTLMAQRETYSNINMGAREAFIEINGDRFNNIKASYARCWFQIDWMMTNECEEKGLNYQDYFNYSYYFYFINRKHKL